MPRGDGRLTHDLLPGEKGPQDACGVFGVWAPGEEVAKLTYFGLYALQHRGQESAGIAVSDGRQILVYKDMGLVSQVFDESHLESLRGHLAIGHTRYSTTGSASGRTPSRPSAPPRPASIALGHNGNLTNTRELAQLVDELRDERRRARRCPARLRAALDQRHRPAHRAARPPPRPLARGRGARGAAASCAAPSRWSSWTRPRSTPPATRRASARWCSAGSSAAGWSPRETAALDIVGARFVREIEPGELIAIDEHGLRTQRFAEAEPKGCLFEYVYLARPDTTIAGRSVHATRVEIGRRLANEAPVEADLVIPVPESGTPAAVGYAQASGIPFGQGLVKNAYVGRTFIQPSQTIRQLGIRLKLNPLREVIAGKRLVVVDDSIVRGNTQRALVRMLREAGAAEVHVRISSPPVKWPCFYGIDFATRAELIANGLRSRRSAARSAPTRSPTSRSRA